MSDTGLVLIALIAAAQGIFVVVFNAWQAKKLREEVREAAQAARDAFTEANHVNNKISDLNARLLERQPTRRGKPLG